MCVSVYRWRRDNHRNNYRNAERMRKPKKERANKIRKTYHKIKEGGIEQISRSRAHVNDLMADLSLFSILHLFLREWGGARGVRLCLLVCRRRLPSDSHAHTPHSPVCIPAWLYCCGTFRECEQGWYSVWVYLVLRERERENGHRPPLERKHTAVYEHGEKTTESASARRI